MNNLNKISTIFQNNKKENIIVFAIMALIVIITLVTIGLDPIKHWLAEPIIWKDADFLNIYLVDKVQENTDELTLLFAVSNASADELDEYEFKFQINSVYFDINSYNQKPIGAHDIITIEKRITADDFASSASILTVDQSTFEYIKNSAPEQIDFSYKIKDLKSNGDTIIKNNGVAKTILLLIISSVIGIIGFSGIIKPAWLRIIFKICALPAIIILLLQSLALVIFGKGNVQNTTASDRAKQRAAQNYKRQAQLKANALQSGRYEDAARTQGQMDKSMADMISSGSSTAKNNYKMHATWKANAEMRGNKKDAARAQAMMDKDLADLITKNKHE